MLERNVASLTSPVSDPAPSTDEVLSRAIDIALAIVALIFLLPLMLLSALAIAAQGDGPILFSHERVGRGGRTFRVLKFRTMAVNGEQVLNRYLAQSPLAQAEWEANYKLRRDPRVNALGRFLRASSIDELPQLLNILRGEMSLVGPRPIVVGEIAKYGIHYPSYCALRPGLTGVWQVSGRNDVPYERRVELDAAYARQKSIAFDARILIATVPAVLLRRGSY